MPTTGNSYAIRRTASSKCREVRPPGSGVPVPGLVRRMFREKHLTWSGDPFAVYDRYSRLPHPAARTGAGGEIVTNLMHHHHSRDPGLRFAFSLLNPFEVTAYARFFARMAATAGMDDSLWRAAA